jgi:Ca2+/Na+ antiporter
MKDQKARAIKRTVGMLALASIVPFLVMALFTYVSLQMLAYAGMALFAGYIIYIIYSINLTRIEYEDGLEVSLKTIKE